MGNGEYRIFGVSVKGMDMGTWKTEEMAYCDRMRAFGVASRLTAEELTESIRRISEANREFVERKTCELDSMICREKAAVPDLSGFLPKLKEDDGRLKQMILADMYY